MCRNPVLHLLLQQIQIFLDVLNTVNILVEVHFMNDLLNITSNCQTQTAMFSRLGTDPFTTYVVQFLRPVNMLKNC